MQTETLSCGAQKRMKEFRENKFNDYKLRKEKKKRESSDHDDDRRADDMEWRKIKEIIGES